MPRYILKPVFTAVLIALSAVVFSACSRNLAKLEEREESHPQYREGKTRMQQLEFDNAIQIFEKLLRENPNMARPHLDLGVLYDERKKDYVRAIYHYETYLKLRPETDKRKWLEQAINHAKMSFVATFPMSPPAAREMEAIRSEVEALRVQNRNLLEALRRHQNQAQGGTSAPVSHPVPAPSAATMPPVQVVLEPAREHIQPPANETYIVQPGDTLGKIAMKVYGHSSKWDVIYEANQEAIPNRSRLQIGQTLIIPR